MRPKISWRPVAATEATKRCSVEVAGGITPESQDIFGFLPESFRQHALRQLGSKMFLQICPGCGIEAPVAEVIPETLFILNFRGFPLGPGQRKNGRES